MDKQEYKLLAEEIKALIAKREFIKAVKIADEIDWTRVRSVAMLCTVSDLYKINRRYQESKELLLMAYERHPGGRMIVYSLCELCLKMGEVVQALEYYKEFVHLAPMDNGKYILQYKIYEAQEVSLEERIAVLEELKKRDYRERWGYELAYLYHRIGLATRCVEECNELILWFSDGRYVKKAMELKMLHQPLTEAQQQNYDRISGKPVTKPENPRESQPETDSRASEEGAEDEIQVKTVNVGQYDTINLQRALAESMKEVLQEEGPGQVTQQIMAPMMQNTEEMEELFVSGSHSAHSAHDAYDAHDAYNVHNMQENKPEVNEEDQWESPPEAPEMQEAPEEVTVSATREYLEEVAVSGPDLSGVEPPAGMKSLLSQGYDGQIRLVVPEEEKVEKQITGQMSIEDVLQEWEKTKKDLEEKRNTELRQRVKQQTGNLLTEFDAKARDGVLEQLEKEDILNEKTKEIPSRVIVEAVLEPEPISEEEIAPVEDLPAIEEPEKTPEVREEEQPPSMEELQETIEEIQEEQGSEEELRGLTEEEKALFAPFIQTRGARKRFVQALDSISLAAYTGNVIVTGEGDSDTVKLAKNVMKYIQMTDANFSGVIAKVTGESLNTKNVDTTVTKLPGGGLIIEKASGMNSQAVTRLMKALNQEQTGIVVILEDNKKAIKRMLAAYPSLAEFFNARVEIEQLSNDALAAYGRQYAAHLEYSIDELGMLALQTRIENMQTTDHVVTVAEVREIVDEAIASADRKNLQHLLDVLMSKRYDEEDMIVLRERDFI